MSIVVGSARPGSFASTLPRQAGLRFKAKLFYPRRQGTAKNLSTKGRHAENRQPLMVAASSMAASAAAVETFYSGLEGFEDRSLSEFNIAVVGDLHLDPEAMGLFYEARDQIMRSMLAPGGAGRAQAGARVVQLGDLGSYHCGPGGWGCFKLAKEYLAGFGVPAATILGNHDLEGSEFESDEENLEAWKQVFRQPHYWCCDVGPLTLIGLSTTRFRSNPDSVHEVHIDEEQLEFLERTLAVAGDRPVAVFTHAPPMGSGLKVVQQVHVKNRCAWLNHSSDPRRFIKLVQAHPNIRLWFSGHYHLSQNYADSVSVVGGCAFVQTGVIGDCNRDGFRQSRVLRGDAEGYRMYTMDHASGALRLDLEHRWDDPAPPRPITPEDELICDPNSGWLCSRIDCELDLADSMEQYGNVKWFSAGPNCMLAFQDDFLVEYDAAMMAPLGLVAMDIPEGCQVVLVDAAGREVDAINTDGSAAVAVELRLPTQRHLAQQLHAAGGSNGHANGSSGGGNSSGSSSTEYDVHGRIERNKAGTFYKVFQQNKWRLRKEKEARELAGSATLSG